MAAGMWSTGDLVYHGCRLQPCRGVMQAETEDRDTMPALNIKHKPTCQWDLVSLGEVMLRLDPGDRRIATTRQFEAWEGGGEYNVARGLRRCFRMETAIVTALADNPVG